MGESGRTLTLRDRNTEVTDSSTTSGKYKPLSVGREERSVKATMAKKRLGVEYNEKRRTPHEYRCA